MIYRRFDNKITVSNANFDVLATLNSGQTFRFDYVDENKILLTSADKPCLIEMFPDSTDVYAEDLDYFIRFFALDEDYKKYLATDDEFALSKITTCPPIRVLVQPRFEMVISAIMSANNNIKRFSKTLKLIAQNYGEKGVFMGYAYYSFPSPEVLANADISTLKSLGCGYRDKYIIETSKAIANGFDLDEIASLNTMTANKRLCSLMGVGEKVADCILLFSYQKYDSFPIDTWIEKVYRDNYQGTLTDRKKIRQFFVDYFGEYAGVIQQYLFYSAINKK